MGLRADLEKKWLEDRQRRQTELQAMLAGDNKGYIRGDVHIYPLIRKAFYGDVELKIRPSKTFLVLDYLAFQPEILRTPYEIAEAGGLPESANALDFAPKQVLFIRRAFAAASKKKFNPIATVYGQGYYWKGPLDGVDL